MKSVSKRLVRCADGFLMRVGCGALIALLHSFFIYTEYYDMHMPLLDTIATLLALWLLIASRARVWFWYGWFTGLLWFWWIALSFKHYHMPWATPIALAAVSLTYATLFFVTARSIEAIAVRVTRDMRYQEAFQVTLKAFFLLTASTIHPFGFDWYKPELGFVDSYIGVEKWRFAAVLAALSLSIVRRNLIFLVLIVFALDRHWPELSYEPPKDFAFVTTHTAVEAKWNPRLQTQRFEALFYAIERAAKTGKEAVILPESVFNVYVMRDRALFERLRRLAEKIVIVIGGLYWDGKAPKNVTYVFHRDGNVTIAQKFILVPFGEANPLPDFLSDTINRIFYDNAVDYVAADAPSDYTVNGVRYRNAICYEATSEKLYRHTPRHIIAISNNGWFVPSIEPTLQRLLLTYYARKYRLCIYHVANMSSSFTLCSD